MLDELYNVFLYSVKQCILQFKDNYNSYILALKKVTLFNSPYLEPLDFEESSIYFFVFCYYICPTRQINIERLPKLYAHEELPFEHTFDGGWGERGVQKGKINSKTYVFSKSIWILTHESIGGFRT